MADPIREHSIAARKSWHKLSPWNSAYEFWGVSSQEEIAGAGHARAPKPVKSTSAGLTCKVFRCWRSCAGCRRNRRGKSQHCCRVFYAPASLNRQPARYGLPGNGEAQESSCGGARKGRRGRRAAGKRAAFGLLKRNGKGVYGPHPDARTERSCPALGREFGEMAGERGRLKNIRGGKREYTINLWHPFDLFSGRNSPGRISMTNHKEFSSHTSSYKLC